MANTIRPGDNCLDLSRWEHPTATLTIAHGIITTTGKTATIEQRLERYTREARCNAGLHHLNDNSKLNSARAES